MTTSSNPFDDPSHVAMYAKRAGQLVPALADVHRLVGVLIDELAPPDARVLVLGAGGGLETKALAVAHSGWSFAAVDPSAAMLDLAVTTLGPDMARVSMHNGYIDDAPPGPFSAATSLLTLHFLPEEERLRTVGEVRRRLVPGAPFVVMHLSIVQRDDSERRTWIDRHVAFLVASGLDPTDVQKARAAIESGVPVLSPDQDRAILRQAGFTGVTEFFSAFNFRGWVGYAPS
ncbi:class I SAM-dependent methyltransferase [Mycobacterium neglectum]|uniref:class I SAM-dependent methyltransferase n=1 Tax=Mycobacterium neglectum TaxID=242737 RepID=UPI001C3F165C|nr:class I SAM-dependent methyltransferase [Mycobacterium neglectum]